MATKYKQNLEEMVAQFPMKVYIYSEPDGGFSVQAPRLATCFASGKTLREALHNYKFAMFDYFDIPMAKQDPNMVTYKFVEIPDEHQEEQNLGEVNINLEQLVGAAN